MTPATTTTTTTTTTTDGRIHEDVCCLSKMFSQLSHPSTFFAFGAKTPQKFAVIACLESSASSVGRTFNLLCNGTTWTETELRDRYFSNVVEMRKGHRKILDFFDENQKYRTISKPEFMKVATAIVRFSNHKDLVGLCDKCNHVDLQDVSSSEEEEEEEEESRDGLDSDRDEEIEEEKEDDDDFQDARGAKADAELRRVSKVRAAHDHVDLQDEEDDQPPLKKTRL